MNDIVALPAGDLEQREVFAGYVRFNGCRIQVDFDAPAGAYAEHTDAAFLKALSQLEGVELDYLCVGTTDAADLPFPEDLGELNLPEVLGVCRWTLDAFAHQLARRIRRRGGEIVRRLREHVFSVKGA
jgi:hypothetical protein